MITTKLVTVLLATALCLAAQEMVVTDVDPFASESKEKEVVEPAKPVEFDSSSGMVIGVSPVMDPSELNSNLWPKHKAPLTLNRRFDRPKQVWELDSGYFISYEAGEWGGALFYLQKGTTTPVRIIEDNVSSVVKVAPHTYVVAGGSEHLAPFGRVYRLWIDKKQRWRSRALLETYLGVPRVQGMTLDQQEALVVFTHWNDETKSHEVNVCSVSASGLVHMYGICKYRPAGDKKKR